MPPTKMPISLSPLARPFHGQNGPGSLQTGCHITAWSHLCCPWDPAICKTQKSWRKATHHPGRGFLPKPHAALLEALLFSRQLAPQAQQSADAQAGRWLFRAGTERGAALLRVGRAAQKPSRQPCEEEITRMEPAGWEGTCHSGLEKGTICPTHVTGNTLRATPPPTHGVRLIARPHTPAQGRQQRR